MTGHRFAKLLVASMALALLLGGCASIVGLGDYTLCNVSGGGGAGGCGGGSGDDGGTD